MLMFLCISVFNLFMYTYSGGSSTKLSFLSLNRNDVNSVHHVMPVAMYEGIGEDYTVLHHVFKPVFDQLCNYIKSFTPTTSTPSPPIPSSQQNAFSSPSCTTCKQLREQHGLHPTLLHSPLLLEHVNKAQLVIAADMPMLRMLIGCQTSAKCHNFCPMCLVTRDDVQPGYVHSPVVLDDYKQHPLPKRSTFPPRTTSSQQQQYQSFITNGHGNIDDAKYYGNVIHSPLISTEIHQHLAALPLHILLGTTKKAMDILTDYCIEHDSIVKQIKGDTGEHM